MKIAPTVSVLHLPIRSGRAGPARPVVVPTRSSWLRRLAWALHLAR